MSPSSLQHQGLSHAQAAQRLAEDGPNQLPGHVSRTWRHIARETLGEPMFLLLLMASVLYLVLGELQEGLILVGLVLVILGLTLYQEGKTERAVQALRDLSSPRARVIREAQAQTIAGLALVRGDILLLAEGDRIAADAMLLSASELLVDESLLTGESEPAAKQAAASTPQAESPTDGAVHRLYSGTLVVRGQAVAQVTATGVRSQMGQIGTALEQVQAEPSPLRQQTAQLVRRLAWIALCLSLLLVVIYGLMRGDWLQALLSGIALAMALLPQEFTVVLTVLPALGAWRLSREKVLTRRIAAIETLGATSVLCVDKTGTLTHNRMTVAHLHVAGADWVLKGPQPGELPEAFHTLVEFSILASEIDPFDPMEQAFHRLGQQFLADTKHIHQDWVLVHEYGLTPQLRAMAHVWRAVGSEAHVVAAKGSPEAIVDLCHLKTSQQQAIAAAVDTMAAQGLRVLAVAQARFAGPPWPAQEHDFDFEFIGLLGLADPLREEIPQAMRECAQAGIRVVMITGDYPVTARAIARQAGLPSDAMLTGDELATLSDAELQQRMQTVSVCARIAPAQKLRIVQALQAGGAVVAMTGDGVNDAPALKAAHVGVAMGGRGTDVAREAAVLVLLDDNFASIVRAVRVGRRIFDNLQKSMAYIMAVHVPMAGMALLPLLLGWPTVLYPMHIAFLELVIDPACSLVFENEPVEGDAMRRPPRDVQAQLFAGSTLWLAFLQGVGVLCVVLMVYAWGAQTLAEPQARALAFATLVVANLALIFSNRSRTQSLWRTLRVPNLTLWVVAGLTLGLLLLALYLPGLSQVLHLAPLPWPWLVLAWGAGLAPVFWFEGLKIWRRGHN
jgi:P-type Ca2+ transporter type 2C